MKVLVYEDNLLWSSRLANSLKKLGHEPILAVERTDEAAVAIVNLGDPVLMALVPLLRASGVVTIGHAGHKEKQLHELGKEAGCDILATNSELTFKIEALLTRAEELLQQIRASHESRP